MLKCCVNVQRTHLPCCYIFSYSNANSTCWVFVIFIQPFFFHFWVTCCVQIFSWNIILFKTVRWQENRICLRNPQITDLMLMLSWVIPAAANHFLKSPQTWQTEKAGLQTVGGIVWLPLCGSLTNHIKNLLPVWAANLDYMHTVFSLQEWATFNLIVLDDWLHLNVVKLSLPP